MATKKAAAVIAKKAPVTSAKKIIKPVTVKATAKRTAKMAAKPVGMMEGGASKLMAKAITNHPSGWKPNPGGKILIEEKVAKSKTVPASKLREGLSAAQDDIKQSLQEIATIMTMDFEVSEIELSMSFSAKGEFLGFGIGGAASIKVKIKPVQST